MMGTLDAECREIKALSRPMLRQLVLDRVTGNFAGVRFQMSTDIRHSIGAEKILSQKK